MDPTDYEKIRQLLLAHVPEMASGAVAIKGLARIPGERLLIAVDSKDSKTCPVGAIVGPKAERIKGIVRSLGEKIDVVRWSESLPELIRNAFAPMHVEHVGLDVPTKTAKTYVRAERLAEAGVSGDTKRQLISELVGWNVQLVEL